MITLLLGGARSGKSAAAVEVARAHPGEVVLVATCVAGDDDLRARVARHRAERPVHWTTVEEPHDLAGAIGTADPDALVVVDCLTFWVANRQWTGIDEATLMTEARSATAAAAARSGSTLVVSNEVGMGVVPPTEEGRRFRDALGRVNQVWADAADAAHLLVAGRHLPLDRLATLSGAPT